ncbi:MAG: hypothetical protein LBD77_02340 [Bifidobacteriaceae bacterium]|jgi:mRNA-degrading endonuclease YafQ of YafQ-DinJ toxin-antitoxin module|nr:hypothetical protein [Bifidobacteriaceae bacterium]
MIRVAYTETFHKALARLAPKQRRAAVGAIELWLDSPTDPRLRVHHLKGDWAGHFSISAGGDLRVHLWWESKGVAVRAVTVGAHSQLYG